MRDILPELLAWTAEGQRFSLATVIETWGSSPRQVGSMMAVREDGLVCGSVSGGCVEGAVIEESLKALGDNEPRHLTFGALDDESLWNVGLSCGGTIKVLVEPDPTARNPDLWRALVARINSEEPCVVTTDLWTCRRSLWIPGDEDETANAAFLQRRSALVQAEGQEMFVQVFAARERLLIVGASHIAIPLVSFAKELGFETVVVDPRAQLASMDRFPSPPDKILTMWPGEAFDHLELTDETYAVMLTHDPKIDDAALALLLRSPVAYIGALGSRSTQEKRRRDLAAQGFTEEELSRIHGPVGLAIGARTPQEIALSIVAEVVQVRRASR